MSQDEIDTANGSPTNAHSNLEEYPFNDDISLSSSIHSSQLITYQYFSWSLLRRAAINLLLPFINGLMLGFGELFAHEAAFRLGWGGTKIFPSTRRQHSIRREINIRDVTTKKNRDEVDDLTSLE